MQKRQTFSKEFKLEAVRLLEATNKPAADLAREQGVRRNQLYKWQEQLRSKGEHAIIAGLGVGSELNSDLQIRDGILFSKNSNGSETGLGLSLKYRW
jgi:hypothetical protein